MYYIASDFFNLWEIECRWCSLLGRGVKPNHWSHSTLDIASLPIKNEARINELPGTKFKRFNTSRKPQEGSFCVTMYFNAWLGLQFLLGFISILMLWTDKDARKFVFSLYMGPRKFIHSGFKEAISSILLDQWTKPATFGWLVQWSANWAARSSIDLPLNTFRKTHTINHL